MNGCKDFLQRDPLERVDKEGKTPPKGITKILYVCNDQSSSVIWSQ